MIGENDCGCSLNEFELFDSINKQVILDRGQWVDVHPVNNISSSAPIEFVINGTGDEFIDLNSSYLCLQLTVKKATGGNLAGTAEVAFINNWIHSAFSDVILTINGTQIEGGNQTYPYKAYLTNLLSHGKVSKATQLQASGWSKDTAGQMNDKTNNTGYAYRKKLCAESKSIELCAPILLDFFVQSKCCLPNTEIGIKLIPSKPEFQLVHYGTNANDAYKVSYEKAIMYVRRVKAVPSFISAIEQNLNLQNAVYPLQHTEVTTYTISQGSKSHNKELLFRGRMPKLVVVGFVSNSAYNGAYGETPFNFEHLNTTHITLYREGEELPQRALQPSFSTDKPHYAREYMGLLQALDIFNRNTDIDLTMDDYKGGYTLFGFNLTPDLCVAGHAQPIRDGNLRLEVNFAEALSKTYNVIVFGIFDGRVEITKMRNVLIDWRQ